jgi:hypothetical protein
VVYTTDSSTVHNITASCSTAEAESVNPVDSLFGPALCPGARVAGATVITGASVAGATLLTGETVAVQVEGSVKGSIPDKGAGAEPKAVN